MDSRDRIELIKSDVGGWFTDSLGLRAGLVILALYLLLVVSLGVMWSGEPEMSDPQTIASSYSSRENRGIVTGTYTTTTLVHIAETLLEKPGGFLSNDVMPPGAILDNMPNWEFGVLVQVRDLARARAGARDRVVGRGPAVGRRGAGRSEDGGAGLESAICWLVEATEQFRGAAIEDTW